MEKFKPLMTIHNINKTLVFCLSGAEPTSAILHLLSTPGRMKRTIYYIKYVINDGEINHRSDNIPSQLDFIRASRLRRARSVPVRLQI